MPALVQLNGKPCKISLLQRYAEKPETCRFFRQIRAIFPEKSHFMIPGWTYHWRKIFEQDFGSMSMDMAKRLFAHYERSLLILTPIMSEKEMRLNTEAFHELFGFRVETRDGTLKILNETWNTAKEFLSNEENRYIYKAHGVSWNVEYIELTVNRRLRRIPWKPCSCRTWQMNFRIWRMLCRIIFSIRGQKGLKNRNKNSRRAEIPARRVIPAEAGIYRILIETVGSRFRGNDRKSSSCKTILQIIPVKQFCKLFCVCVSQTI
ncbi:MAG: hypothetical protein DRI57_25085 [Deltaproteobacteria bacterium]|nr:MAG: hypothetical protein DRI57_25085 [Deltaproteobacteria bacterium]